MSDSLAEHASNTGRKFLARQDGSVGVILAILVTPLVMMLGIGLDYKRAMVERDRLQSSLDAAVLAAVGVASDKQETAARLTFSANWADAESIESLSFQSNPDGSLAGTARARIPTAFGGLVAIKTISVQVSAKAGFSGGSSAPATKSCLLILDGWASQALLVNSGATVNAPACEIDVASQGSPAAIFNSQVSLNVSGICVRSTSVIRNGGPVQGLRTGCATPANPFADALPRVNVGACTVSNQNYSGTQTLYPGVYCGNFNFNGVGTLNLSPGLYVFKNTRWNLNSGWAIKGTGTTFYFSDSNSYIQVNSSVDLDLTAPINGSYANILIFEPDNLAKSSFSLNGSAEHKLNGLIYLPSRNVTFNSGSKITSSAITMVFNQVIWDRINWTLGPGVRSIDSASATPSSRGSKYLIH